MLESKPHVKCARKDEADLQVDAKLGMIIWNESIDMTILRNRFITKF